MVAGGDFALAGTGQIIGGNPDNIDVQLFHCLVERLFGLFELGDLVGIRFGQQQAQLVGGGVLFAGQSLRQRGDGQSRNRSPQSQSHGRGNRGDAGYQFCQIHHPVSSVVREKGTKKGGPKPS